MCWFMGPVLPCSLCCTRLPPRAAVSAPGDCENKWGSGFVHGRNSPGPGGPMICVVVLGAAPTISFPRWPTQNSDVRPSRSWGGHLGRAAELLSIPGVWWEG